MIVLSELVTFSDYQICDSPWVLTSKPQLLRFTGYGYKFKAYDLELGALHNGVSEVIWQDCSEGGHGAYGWVLCGCLVIQYNETQLQRQPKIRFVLKYQ